MSTRPPASGRHDDETMPAGGSMVGGMIGALAGLVVGLVSSAVLGGASWLWGQAWVLVGAAAGIWLGGRLTE